MRIEKWTIGTDPELFLEKDGIIISAEGLIGGTKNEPKPISDNGHFIQEDNVMVEFNIPPCNNKEEFIYNINHVKEYLDVLANVNGMKLNYTTSYEFTKEEVRTPQARMFGCEPSWNVYLKDQSPSPSSRTKWRGCGGHIHIGYNEPDQDTSELLVYGMDMILGLKSIIIDPDTKRRTTYGKAGEFRWKDFGIEYRTLSNFWIKNNQLMGWVYESTALVIDIINEGIMLELIEKYANDVQNAINNSNVKLAEETLTLIINHYKEVKEINKTELILEH